MSAFKLGDRAGGEAGIKRFAVGVEDYRQPFEPARERGFGRAVLNTLGAFVRLIIPVFLLLALGATSVAYANQNADVLGNPWMSLGLALLPMTFVAVHLTNRRYGAAYAVWQVIIAWGVGAAVVLGGGENSVTRVPIITREVIAFAAALFVAQMVAIVVFDRLRGPHWWQAPLFASLIGGLMLSLIAFPVAYAGTPINWTSRMIDYVTWTTMMSLGLLVPYWLMRSFVLPRSGFGGY